MSKKVLVSFSGGADSTTVLSFAYHIYGKQNVQPVYFYYGQKHYPGEWNALAALKQKMGFTAHRLDIDLKQFGRSTLTDPNVDVPNQDEGRQASTVVPFRNTMFLVHLAAKAVVEGYDIIALGPTFEDLAEYPDCRPAYFESMQQSLRLADRHHHLQIWTPYVAMKKAEVIKQGLQYRVPYEWTWTCYNGVWNKPCRTCDACREREASFNENNLEDPLIVRLRDGVLSPI